MFRALFLDNLEIIENRIKRKEQRTLRSQMEHERQINAREISSNRYNMLILTGILAVLLAIFSVFAQLWVNKDKLI